MKIRAAIRKKIKNNVEPIFTICGVRVLMAEASKAYGIPEGDLDFVVYWFRRIYDDSAGPYRISLDGSLIDDPESEYFSEKQLFLQQIGKKIKEHKDIIKYARKEIPTLFLNAYFEIMGNPE